jgi:chromosome segregation ATPase
MRLRISSLSAAKDKLEKSCHLLQTELDSRGSELKETISQLEKDLAAVKVEKERLVGKILRDHKSEKANMKSEIDRLSAATAELKDEVRKSRLVIHIKEDQLAKLKKRVGHLEMEVTDLIQDKADLDVQLSTTLSERDIAVDSASTLGDRASSLQEALTETLASEKRLQMQNQELEQLLEASQSLLGETEEQMTSLKATAAIESITSAKDILMRRNMELQRTIFERDSETHKAIEDVKMMERQVTNKDQLVKDCTYKIGVVKDDLQTLRRTETVFSKILIKSDLK